MDQQPIKFLEAKKGTNFYDLGLSNGFSDKTQRKIR
jgi:hypothetical protein